MKGFFNQILSVDLTRGTFQREAVNDRIYKEYLGGRDWAPGCFPGAIPWVWTPCLRTTILYLPPVR